MKPPHDSPLFPPYQESSNLQKYSCFRLPSRTAIIPTWTMSANNAQVTLRLPLKTSSSTKKSRQYLTQENSTFPHPPYALNAVSKEDWPFVMKAIYIRRSVQCVKSAPYQNTRPARTKSASTKPSTAGIVGTLINGTLPIMERQWIFPAQSLNKLRSLKMKFLAWH